MNNVLHITLDVLLRVPEMSPSSNTQLFQKTAMVRNWHGFHLIYDSAVSFTRTFIIHSVLLFYPTSSSQVRVQHGLKVWVLLTMSWSALGRVQFQSVISPLATWLRCRHTLWWHVQKSTLKLSAFFRTSRSGRVVWIRNRNEMFSEGHFCMLHQIIITCNNLLSPGFVVPEWSRSLCSSTTPPSISSSFHCFTVVDTLFLLMLC